MSKAASRSTPPAPGSNNGVSPAPTKTTTAASYLSIRSISPSFRRAGRTWTAAETIVAANEFTDEQIAALHAEPQLVVTAAAAPQGQVE